MEENGSKKKVTISFERAVTILATIIAIILGIEKMIAGRYVTVNEFTSRTMQMQIQLYREMVTKHELKICRDELAERVGKLEDEVHIHFQTDK